MTNWSNYVVDQFIGGRAFFVGSADELGQVYGKTGEAEFPGGSHAWFTGYRGDLAFAGLIVGGGSSSYAVRMVRQMLEELPPDFLA